MLTDWASTTHHILSWPSQWGLSKDWPRPNPRSSHSGVSWRRWRVWGVNSFMKILHKCKYTLRMYYKESSSNTDFQRPYLMKAPSWRFPDFRTAKPITSFSPQSTSALNSKGVLTNIFLLEYFGTGVSTFTLECDLKILLWTS